MARPHSLTFRAGVLQGDNLASFLFVIVLDYVLRLSFDSINDKVRTSKAILDVVIYAQQSIVQTSTSQTTSL